MLRLTHRGLLAVALLISAAPAFAQSISQALPALAANGARLDPDTPHFPTPPAGAATVTDLTGAIGLRLASFPMVQSWGTPTAASAGSGDNLALTSGSFAERVATGGRGHFRVGLMHQGAEYGFFDGRNLRSSELKLVLAHSGPHLTANDADAVEQVISMDLDRHVIALFGAVGVTDRLDVGVIVPSVAVNVNARIASFIQRAVSLPDETHSFDALQLGNRTVYGDWTRVGIGDIEARAKFRAAEQLALTAGVRLPTGDADNWLGLGAWQVSGGAIWSASAGRVAPRANAGYIFSGSRSGGFEVPDEITYGGGVDVAVSRYVSLSADGVGRFVRAVDRLRTGSLTLPPGTGAQGYVADDVLLGPASTNVLTLFGVGGVRVLASSRLLLSGDFFFPVLERGLVPRMGIALGANVLF